MSESILISIQITLVGMTLVFLALILLWWLMELLVRVTAGRAVRSEEVLEAVEELPPASGITPVAQTLPDEELSRRQQAAVVAVSLALAERDRQIKEFPIPPTAIVSAWQAVNRANMLNRRGQVR